MKLARPVLLLLSEAGSTVCHMPNVALVTTAHVAAALNVHVRTVHRWVDAGRLAPAMKIPGIRGAYLFNQADVDALLTRELTPRSPP